MTGGSGARIDISWEVSIVAYVFLLVAVVGHRRNEEKDMTGIPECCRLNDMYFVGGS
jgi:hypothetical protein